MFDILISDVYIINGQGASGFYGSIGINNGRITYVGSNLTRNSRLVINGNGLFASPGFIDIHSHSELLLLENPLNPYKILQGVTTEIMGNCGFSIFPLPLSKHTDDWKRFMQNNFSCTEVPVISSIDDYIKALATIGGTTVNYGMMVGHGSVRTAVMGSDSREPTVEEINMMQNLIAIALEEGAFGLSCGLLFAPGCFATENELIELAKPVKDHKGILACHVRNEAGALRPSIEEFLRIARQSCLPAHISHLKVTGRSNAGSIGEILAFINESRSKGMDITFDQYPYNAGNTLLTTLLPPWVQEQGIEQMLVYLQNSDSRRKIKRDLKEKRIGMWENISLDIGWDKIILVESITGKFNHWCGKTVQEIASYWGKTEEDCLMDLLLEEQGDPHIVIEHMDEEDILNIMREGTHLVSSDGLYKPGYGGFHPRLCGSFPRFLRYYVKEKKVIPLEKAISHMSYLPAKRLGLKDRGLIQEGAWADLVLFDWERIKDKATYLQPNEYAEGVEYLFVNGRMVIKEGEFTEERPGICIRRT